MTLNMPPAVAKNPFADARLIVSTYFVCQDRLVDNISQSYSLAYSPTNLSRDGKRRRIRVELSPEVEKREGQIVLHARRSYTMAKEDHPKPAF